VLGLWEFAVRVAGIPPYLLPGPWLIMRTLVTDWPTLSVSLWITLEITGLALAAAVVVGGLLSTFVLTPLALPAVYVIAERLRSAPPPPTDM